MCTALVIQGRDVTLTLLLKMGRLGPTTRHLAAGTVHVMSIQLPSNSLCKVCALCASFEMHVARDCGVHGSEHAKTMVLRSSVVMCAQDAVDYAWYCCNNQINLPPDPPRCSNQYPAQHGSIGHWIRPNLLQLHLQEGLSCTSTATER